MRGFRTLFLSAVLAALAAPLGAAERVIDLSSGTGSFVGDGPRLQDGDDFITFTNLSPGTYSYKFTLSGEGIEGLAASVNGQNAGTFTVGERSFAGLEGRDVGSFTVQITGRPAGNAAYQGVLTVTPEPVPEPARNLLLASGLGALAAGAAWLHLRKAATPKAAPPA
jgi:hypothetical protein